MPATRIVHPSLYERFGGGFFADPATRVIIFSPFGDPRLSPDRYRTVDAGVDQYFWGDRAIASATVFGIDAKSLTEFDFSGGIDPATDPFGRFFGYLNGSGGSSKGLELSLDTRPAPSLSVRALVRPHRLRNRGRPCGRRLLQSHLACSATRRRSSSLTTGGTYNHTAVEVFHASSSYTALFANGRSRAFRFPGFTTVGVTSSYRVTRGGPVPIRAYLRLDNLFDETYYLGGWRAPGRTAAVGMSIGF